jgi:hypothetical protein
LSCIHFHGFGPDVRLLFLHDRLLHLFKLHSAWQFTCPCPGDVFNLHRSVQQRKDEKMCWVLCHVCHVLSREHLESFRCILHVYNCMTSIYQKLWELAWIGVTCVTSRLKAWNRFPRLQDVFLSGSSTVEPNRSTQQRRRSDRFRCPVQKTTSEAKTTCRSPGPRIPKNRVSQRSS